MGDDRDEASSTPSSDERESASKTCVNCGAVIDTAEWYPVSTERDADGSLRIRAFCSEECRAESSDEGRD